MGELITGQFVDATDLDPITFSPGDVKISARRFPEEGWLKGGQNVSRTTFADLFAAIVPNVGAFTVTLASPGVFTLIAHQLVIGDQVYLVTTGALPTGLAANTLYYVVSTPSADTFTLSATRGGSAINTSGSQSGTHHLFFCPYGLGDGSTTFGLPDLPGRTVVDAAGASGHASVAVMGESDGVALANRAMKHNSTLTGSPTLSGVPKANGSGNTAAPLASGPFVLGSSSNGSATIDIPIGTLAAGVGSLAVGPGGTLPVDQPANLVLNLFVKT